MHVTQKRWWTALFVAVFVASFFALLVPTHTAFADQYPPSKTDDSGKPICDDKTEPTVSVTLPNDTKPTLYCDDSTKTPGTIDPNAKNEATNCAVEKIGWILCPIIEGSAKLSDRAFEMLANNFLRTEPGLVNDQSGTKQAWEIARNLANIMFIIAFLVIIFSQVTGRGLNNYGIKKMMPRLIVAAIAVNASYYICQLAVDATNILGYEIQNALVDISNSLGPSVFGDASQYSVGQAGSTGTTLVVITGAILGIAAFVWFGVGLLGSVVLFVLVTVITIIIILLLRKALIVLLVVVSPIAFVLYLLPNTERLFSRWLKMFWQLLMVFPVVGLLFGSGQLASTILLVSGSQSSAEAQASVECNPDNKDDRLKFNSGTDGNTPPVDTFPSCGAPSVELSGCKDGSTDGKCGDKKIVGVSMGLVAMGVAVAPLLAVWAVLKGALSAAGAIGGKIAANVQKGSDRGVRGGSKAIGEKYKASTLGQMRARDKKINALATRDGTYEGKNPIRRARTRFNRSLNTLGLDENGKEKEGYLNGRLKHFSDQRNRMINKDDNEYIRDKAQEFIADSTAGSEVAMTKLLGADGLQSSDLSARKDALMRLKAHRMAVAQTEGKAGVEAFDNRVAEHGVTGAMSQDGAAYVRSITQARDNATTFDNNQQRRQATAIATALAPHLSTINPQAQMNAARRQLNNTQQGRRPGTPPNPNIPNNPAQPGNQNNPNNPGGNGTPPTTP